MKRVVGSLIVLVLVIGGFAWLSLRGDDLDPKPVGGEDALAGVPESLRSFYQQKLTWKSCQDDFECSSYQVPLDYDHPDKGTITLKMLKAPASDQKNKLGTMLVNPGGPGGPAQDYAAGGASYWGKALRRNYDIIGVDPRGVAASDPVDCVTDAQLDEIIESDPTPDTPQEWKRDDKLNQMFFSGCMKRDPEVATHISTEEAARDMDVLRGILGETKLTYFGASYGTFLGGTYADLFPERVGRMVLDGAIDPSQTTVQMSLVQAHGFQVALDAYLQDCVDKGNCYLGDSVEAGQRRIQKFFEQVDQQPMQVDAVDRELTEGTALYGVILPLYNKDYWSYLDQALGAALKGEGLQLLALADAYTSRGPGGQFLNNSFQALPVVNCLDYDDPISQERAIGLIPRFEKASPTFGRAFVSDLSSCAAWSFQSGKKGATLQATGADPILVVGTTRDPATPLSWAKALSAQLDNSVLLIRDGDGHTGYNAGNQCTDDAIESYLVEGKVPADNTRC
ncbi:MAG: alpha/beta hydrolase [Nocardioidaceae bacterium]